MCKRVVLVEIWEHQSLRYGDKWESLLIEADTGSAVSLITQETWRKCYVEK